MKLRAQKHTDALMMLLESNLEQLTTLDSEIELSPSLDLYRQALISFLSGDADSLSNLGHEAESFRVTYPFLPLAVRLRLEILTRTMESRSLTEIKLPPTSDPWSGEISMLLATAWERLEDFPRAIEFNKLAARLFVKHGLRGKALRARYNATTLLGHADPSRNLVKEYYFHYRAAKKLRQHTVMTAALLNVSREYQKVGAARMALKYAQKSLAASGPDTHGQTYYLAVAQRAHVLFDLGRKEEARLDLEEARTASFPSVKGACALLDRLFGELTSEGGAAVDIVSLRNTWRERLQDARGTKAPKFSENEERTLQYISEKPRSKFEIMDHLFGTDIDPFAADNRLKNIIHRIRKKAPGIIILEEGKFRFADRDLITQRKPG